MGKTTEAKREAHVELGNRVRSGRGRPSLVRRGGIYHAIANGAFDFLNSASNFEVYHRVCDSPLI